MILVAASLYVAWLWKKTVSKSFLDSDPQPWRHNLYCFPRFHAFSKLHSLWELQLPFGSLPLRDLDVCPRLTLLSSIGNLLGEKNATHAGVAANAALLLAIFVALFLG